MGSETNFFLSKLSALKGYIDQPHLRIDRPEEYQVQLIPDQNVSPAKFIKDTKTPSSYRAHPLTIRAVRKEIFTAGDFVLDDLECLFQCEKCNHSLDLQFWNFCPYCEAHLPSPQEFK